MTRMRTLLVPAIGTLTLVVLSAQQVPGRDAARLPAAVGTATLSGTLVTDEANGRPVRRATVSLSGAEAFTGQSAVTDDAGRFSFTKLAGGRYTLTASRAGFINAAYGSKRPGRPGTPIAIEDGQALTGVTLKILRGAVITGTVRDTHGEPAPGMRVSVMRYGFGFQNGEKQLQQAAAGAFGEATDDRGVYRVYGLPPGEYLVVVATGIGPLSGNDTREVTPDEVQWAMRLLQQPGSTGSAPPPAKGQSVDYAPVFYPGTTSASSATMVTLAAGEERTGVDVPMQMIPTSRITGAVVSSDGPLPPALQVNMISHTQITGLPFDGFSSGRADADGHFTFPGVAPGKYTITVRAVAGPGGRAGGPPAGPAASTLYGLSDVDVAGHDLAVTIPLLPGVTVSGHVVFDGTTIKPPADLTRLRVSLNAVLTSGGAALGVPPATVDAEGVFTFSGVTPGRYRITASVPGSSPTAGWLARSAIVNKDQDVVEAPLQVGTDPVSGIVLTFTDQRTELSGLMQDAGGHPAPEYFIIVFPKDKSLWIPQSRRIQAVRPGADGKYRAPNLPPGDYLVAAVTDVEQGEWYDPSFLSQLVPAAIRITLAEGEKKVQDIRVGG